MDEPKLIQLIAELILCPCPVIPVQEFARAYDEAREISRRSSPYASVLASSNNVTNDAVRYCIQEALGQNFFLELWARLVTRLAMEEDKTFARMTEDGKQAVQEILLSLKGRADGKMQSVLTSKGFRRVKTFPALVRAARATALVKVGGAQRGTGFLVGADLLITAAHVVHSLLEGGSPVEGSADEIEVEFHNRLEASGEWPKMRHVAKNWLVAMSPPWGEPPVLYIDNTTDAPNRLDFALIRLADKVGLEIEPIDIQEPPKPSEAPGVNLTVIGYPGGSDCLSDDQSVEKIDDSTKRLLHGANTLNGMSGGPCLDDKGLAIAIHEGTIEQPQKYNRAVTLRDIRLKIRTIHPDPLVADIGPISQLTSAQARQDWILAARRRIGANEQEKIRWLRDVAAFDIATPTDAKGGELFHPVFGRRAFQEWIDAASVREPARRTAFISGSPGSGKSFSVSILRAKLATTANRVILMPPEILSVSTTLPAILAKVERDIEEEFVLTVEPQTKGPRPIAGLMRLDFLPRWFETVERLMNRHKGGPTRLWLVFDFGEDINLGSELAPQWKEFLAQAYKKLWLRTIFIGLGALRQKEFALSIGPKDYSYTEEISPLSFQDYEDCVADVLRSFLPSATLADAADQIASGWQTIENLETREGRVIVAVRALLELRASLKGWKL